MEFVHLNLFANWFGIHKALKMIKISTFFIFIFFAPQSAGSVRETCSILLHVLVSTCLETGD